MVQCCEYNIFVYSTSRSRSQDHHKSHKLGLLASRLLQEEKKEERRKRKKERRKEGEKERKGKGEGEKRDSKRFFFFFFFFFFNFYPKILSGFVFE